jgi:putative ABC transport system permease protein
LLRFEDVVEGAVARPRFRTTVIGSFASLALLLAAVGIYGVLSQSVIQRQREFGIRMALGATSREILTGVLGRGLALSSVGALAGTVAALALVRWYSRCCLVSAPGIP